MSEPNEELGAKVCRGDAADVNELKYLVLGTLC